MPSQRLILGTSLAILLVISAASIGLDFKSQSDKASVDHTVGVLQKIADARLLVRSAESVSRGFGLTRDPNFTREFQETADAIGPAFEALIAAAKDNPGQMRLFEETKALVDRRLAVSSELMRLRAAGDTAAVEAQVAKAEGRSAMAMISANFDKAVAEERMLLGARTAQSTSTGRFLIAVDVTGVALILMLAVTLMRQTRRSNRELADSLSATRATNESLEAAVAERTEHLVAANEKLRHSSSVMQSTFHSMAEAVLVIDTQGEVMLANAAAEKMLRYRPGMNVMKLRALSTGLHADGGKPLTVGY